MYDKYNFLITRQAEADIDDFLNGEHTFKEFCREVKKYNKLFEDITYKSRKVCLFLAPSSQKLSSARVSKIG